MPTRSEPGGQPLTIGPLISETFEEFTANIGNYLIGGLGLFIVAMPVGMIIGFLSIFVVYVVMIGGSVASVLAGSATGDQDLGAMISIFGSMGSFVLAFALMFGLIGLVGALVAPLGASLARAVAAQQRGDKKIELNAAFSTATQGMVPSIVVAFLVTLSTLVGVLFCYVGAFVPMVFFGFAAQMVAQHGVAPTAAMRRSAQHAMANLSDHVLFFVVYMGMSMIAAYIPVIGQAFLLALIVRAYRRAFGDGAEPVG